MEKVILKAVACVSVAATVIGIAIVEPEGLGALIAIFGVIAITIIAKSK